MKSRFLNTDWQIIKNIFRLLSWPNKTPEFVTAVLGVPLRRVSPTEGNARVPTVLFSCGSNLGDHAGVPVVPSPGPVG